LVWSIGAGAVIVRLAFVAWAGNKPETALSGGSDTLAYQTLADNLANRHGMSYAGEPTALRPPLYPLLLAFGQFAVGKEYRLFIRLVQLVLGCFMAIICARLSRNLGGSAPISFIAALSAPTLVFFSAEILTETLAALIVSAFFFVVATEASPILAGALIGLGMLERFNLSTLAVVYGLYQFMVKKPAQASRRVVLGGLVATAVVSPWFIRNLIAFQGQVLYSTHTGTNLLQGLLTPDGRTQPGDTAKLEAAAGWTISNIETNSPSRTTFPSEPKLDRVATKAALLELHRVNISSLVIQKLGYFWLSFDQLFRTGSLSRGKFLIRLAGIVLYWFLLGLAIAGWNRLKARNRDAALLFAIYAVVVTIMHIPFVMSTRIRAPLIEPALVILAGLAFAQARLGSTFTGVSGTR